MGENCKDCMQIKIIERDAAELKSQVAEIKSQVAEQADRITDLERRQDVAQERTETIFNILSEIKDSINRIAHKIDTIENRPSAVYWATISAVAAAVVVAGFKAIGGV